MDFMSNLAIIGDPFHRFPYEIWTKCVGFAAYGNSAGPFPFLLVSQSWKKSIIETPEVWTSLVIDEDEECEARLHTHLHLSKTRLIDVHIQRHLDSVQGNLELVLKASDRIRAIVVQLTNNFRDEPYVRNTSFDQFFYWLDNGATCYPSMEEYVVEGYYG